MRPFARPSPLHHTGTMSGSAADTATTTPAALNLAGTPGNDTLEGGDGNDQLSGGGGDDVLKGGGGNDLLDGGEGNDLLEGGDGNDTFNGEVGDDTLRGGNGDDELHASYFGSSVLEGGAGNDRLRSYAGGNDSLDGGDGDDSLLLMQPINAPQSSTITLSGGAGNDRISIVAASRVANVIVSGGEGADLIHVGRIAYAGKLSILDFGATDQLDLQEYLPYRITENPFGAGGYWKAVQEGADVGIYIDQDGAAGGNAAYRLLTLANTSLASLTKANFVGGFDPAGGNVGSNGPIGRTIVGTTGDDILFGGELNDTIDGGAGNDNLRGEAGDDKLSGGDGDDTLNGGHGNDRLEGGDGKDILSDSAGADYLSGGAGDDILTSTGGVPGAAAETVLDGGDGNDRFEVGAPVKAVLGGAGDDVVDVTEDGGPAGRAPLLVDLGEGNDHLNIRTGTGETRALRVSGGAGVDTYRFVSGHSRPVVTITDFQTGAGGDVLDTASFAYTTGDGMPVGPRLVQDGSHVLLQVDPDGALGAQSWATRVVFENTRLADLTGANFTNGSIPVGSPPVIQPPVVQPPVVQPPVVLPPVGAGPGLVLIGTSGDDVVEGSLLDDILRGGDGSDMLQGNGGADQLHGDGGNDYLFGGDGNDRLEGGIGNDILNGEAGDDELLGGPGNDTLEDRLGNNILRGGEGDDQIHTGGNGSDQVFGEDGNDLMFIAGGGRFDGGEGGDAFFLSLDGASTASLQLSGGAGRDSYAFLSAATGASVTITDFAAGAGGDYLQIDKLVAVPSGNPFAPGGSLQFVQRGADTVLQLRVGQDGASTFQDVVVLRDIARTALTSENIVLDFDPQGGSNGLRSQGSDGADRLLGTVNEDTLRGGAGNDVLTGGGGYDVLDGGAGIDAALFSGARSQYKVERLAPDAQDMAVSDLRPGVNEGKDRLLGIERLVFADGALALDTGPDGIAGQAYRIYRAAFDRAPDDAGLGFWIAAMDGGSKLAYIAGEFVRSQEFVKLYGAAPSNAELVTRLYRNILDREPEQAGYEYWLDVLDRKLVDLPSLLAQFSESGENRAAVAELIANGVNYLPYGG